MTRTTKHNDPPRNNPEAMTAMQETATPKFYGKTNDVDTAPGKAKKDGGGKGNWGHAGDESVDMENINFTKSRRRSNSNSAMMELKTKFEINEHEPVFEEELHGAGVHDDENGEALSTSSTNESNLEGVTQNGVAVGSGGTLGA